MRKIPGAVELAMLNPHQLDAVAIYRGRFGGASLIDPLRRFANLKRYRWRGLVSPPAALQTVPARGQIDDSFSVAPGSFITSISGFCDQPEGFVMQITDKGSGRTLADAPARYLCLTGGSGSKYPGRPLPFVLTDPFVITAPGLLMVKIVSLSVNPQNINVFLSVAERS